MNAAMMKEDTLLLRHQDFVRNVCCVMFLLLVAERRDGEVICIREIPIS